MSGLFDSAGYSVAGVWRRRLWAIALLTLLPSANEGIIEHLDQVKNLMDTQNKFTTACLALSKYHPFVRFPIIENRQIEFKIEEGTETLFSMLPSYVWCSLVTSHQLFQVTCHDRLFSEYGKTGENGKKIISRICLTMHITSSACC